MSGLFIPVLKSTSSLKRFVGIVQDEVRPIAIGWESSAVQCAEQWNKLPLDRARFGKDPGDQVARHLHYMAKLLRNIGKTAGLLEDDYWKYIATPLQVSQAPEWDVNA